MTMGFREIFTALIVITRKRKPRVLLLGEANKKIGETCSAKKQPFRMLFFTRRIVRNKHYGLCPWLFINIVFVVLVVVSLCYAEDSPKIGKAPDIFTNKTRISEKELIKKRDGKYWTLLGGPGYSPDRGFVLAMLGGYYDNGGRDEALFAYTPYKHSLIVAPSWSTKGMYSILFDWDAPYISNTPYRIRTHMFYVKNPTERYFGIGEESLRKLKNPEGVVFNAFNDYNNDLLLIHSGVTDAYYNFYEKESILGNINVEKDVFSGLARIVGGIYLSKVWIRDYTGKKVPGTEEMGSDKRTDAVMRETKLLKDYNSSKVTGFNGGWDNSLRLGFAYDTRDLESNPRKGMFHDLTYVISDKMIGSDFDYNITTLTTRFFYSPFKKFKDLILAARLAYSIKNGDIPFFNMNYMPTTDKHIYGLGGDTTLRGFKQTRFMGPVIALGNIEARFVFANFNAGKQNIELMLVPFWDFGRVFDKVENTKLQDFKYSYGLGLRSGISQSFVLSFDLGFSEEEKGLFYINFGTIF